MFCSQIAYPHGRSAHATSYLVDGYWVTEFSMFSLVGSPLAYTLADFSC